MKKFLSLCLASLMILASASTVLADDGIMLISETTAVPDQIVIDDVDAPKTAPIYTDRTYGWTNPWFKVPEQVTIKVEAGENGSVSVPAKFYAAVTSSRTFDITPDAGYEVADIVVNGVSYGPAYSVKLKNIQVAMDIEVTFAPKLVYTVVAADTFDDADASLALWNPANNLENFAVADGVATMDSVGGDPFFQTASELNLNCEDIDVIRIRYINNTESNALQVFFTTETIGYSEDASFKVTTEHAGTGEYAEIVIETAGNANWTGVLKNIRFDLSSAAGSFVVDSISLESVSLDIAE